MLDGSNNLGRERPIYPAEETTGQQVHRIRQLDSLAFKDVNQLKEAFVVYGAHASFTVALLESFAKLNLTPSDWTQLCKACLSGGEYLLWRGDMQKYYKETVWHNATTGFPQHNLDMLLGEGQYSDPAAQNTYDPAVYAQIAVAAIKA